MANAWPDAQPAAAAAAAAAAAQPANPGVFVGAQDPDGMEAWRQTSARISTWLGLMAEERGKQAPEPSRIADLNNKISGDEERLHTIEAELRVKSPGFYQAISPQARLLAVHEIAAQLPKRSALLQYFFLGDDLLAWAISDDATIIGHPVGADIMALARDLLAFHHRCEARLPTAHVGQRLADALLAPLASMVDAAEHLVIVPYGPAWIVPFHALPWQGVLLAASHAASYLPSASVLQFLRANPARSLPDSVLAVGNPASMSFTPAFGARPQALAPLPAAAIEARHIASLFATGRALVRADATAAAVRKALPRHRLVHFATHGDLVEDTPLMSALCRPTATRSRWTT